MSFIVFKYLFNILTAVNKFIFLNEYLILFSRDVHLKIKN